MTESQARAAAAAVLGLRIAYGAGLILAPARLAQRWLGPESARAPTQVPLRGLGMREVVLHAGALAAALAKAPLRPWLVASITGDLTDVAATVAGRRQLPAGSAKATLAVGGGSALISAALAIAVKR
jgi:hypothetical protein